MLNRPRTLAGLLVHDGIFLKLMVAKQLRHMCWTGAVSVLPHSVHQVARRHQTVTYTKDTAILTPQEPALIVAVRGSVSTVYTPRCTVPVGDYMYIISTENTICMHKFHAAQP